MQHMHFFRAAKTVFFSFGAVEESERLFLSGGQTCRQNCQRWVAWILRDFIKVWINLFI